MLSIALMDLRNQIIRVEIVPNLFERRAGLSDPWIQLMFFFLLY
jgi:hypothetical protein